MFVLHKLANHLHVNRHSFVMSIPHSELSPNSNRQIRIQRPSTPQSLRVGKNFNTLPVADLNDPPMIEAPVVFQTYVVPSVQRHRMSDVRSSLKSLRHWTSRMSTQSSSPPALVPDAVKLCEPVFANGEPVMLVNVPTTGSYQHAVADPLS